MIQLLFLFFNEIVDHVFVFSKVVSFLVLRNGPVFDRFRRTVADTRHAVRAGISPHGLFVRQPNVVQRAKPFAFSTSHTGVLDIKIPCGQLVFTPNGIERKRNDFLK